MTLLEDLIESEQVTVVMNNEGDHDRFQHYFTKEDINNNLMFGWPMKALCGKVVEQQVDPQGRPVCETCTYVYNEIVKKG